MRRSLKATVDAALVFGLVFMGLTGFALYLAPSGRIAKETGWTFLGTDRATLAEMHTFMGFAMLLIAISHLTLNWKVFVSLLKTVRRKNIVAIVLVIAALVVGAYLYSLSNSGNGHGYGR